MITIAHPEQSSGELKRSEKDLFDDDYAIFFPDFLHKGICCEYSFELHRQCNSNEYPQDFVCVEVLRPSQPNGVKSSVVSLPNHTFTGQA